MKQQNGKKKFNSKDVGGMRGKVPHRGNNNKSDKSLGKGESKDSIPDKNDWSFYAASEQIAKDIASIPFNYISGGPFHTNITVDDIQNPEFNETYQSDDSIYNLGLIRYIPSIGITNAKNEGVNMAALQLYAYVRRSNSGARNYEAPDLMCYGLALKDVYREFFEIKRIIGLANKYHYFNHAIPDVILSALNIDADDLRANIAQYRGQLNVMARKINSFAYPKYFKAFDRAAFVSSYIFCDSTSARSQFYCFNSTGYYKWSGTVSQTGTSLVYTNTLSDTITTLQDKFDILSDMVDALFLDEDALTMAGDILKAFPDSELFQLAETAEDYATEFVFDEDVLGQIENATFINQTGTIGHNELSSATFNCDITQENQIIKFNPSVLYADRRVPVTTINSFVFNSHKDQADYKDNLEWSRLMIQLAVNKSNNQLVEITTCGLEIPVELKMFCYNFAESNGGNNTLSGSYMPQAFTNAVSSVATADLMHVLQFDWHPVIYFLYRYTDTANGLYVGFDSKVTTLINYSTLKRINDCAVYGAFFANNLFNQS